MNRIADLTTLDDIKALASANGIVTCVSNAKRDKLESIVRWMIGAL